MWMGMCVSVRVSVVYGGQEQKRKPMLNIENQNKIWKNVPLLKEKQSNNNYGWIYDFFCFFVVARATFLIYRIVYLRNTE